MKTVALGHRPITLVEQDAVYTSLVSEALQKYKVSLHACGLSLPQLLPTSVVESYLE